MLIVRHFWVKLKNRAANIVLEGVKLIIWKWLHFFLEEIECLVAFLNLSCFRNFRLAAKTKSQFFFCKVCRIETSNEEKNFVRNTTVTFIEIWFPKFFEWWGRGTINKSAIFFSFSQKTKLIFSSKFNRKLVYKCTKKMFSKKINK